MSGQDGKASKKSLSLEGRTAEEVVSFVLGVLAAHFHRKAENAQAQVEALARLDATELESFWIQLKKSASTEDALYIFTNWIEGKVDGDGLSSKKASDGH